MLSFRERAKLPRDLQVDSGDPLIGRELGVFRPLRVIGRGGMGIVYEAEDLALRRRVALKVLAPHLVEDTRARERFQREIEHAVAIEHPYVVPLYTAGFERPHFYIAMRLVAGPDLSHVLREEGGLPEERALTLLGQIASALHAVHAKGLIHRDVKPQNVLLWNAGGGEEHAMLTDFGIAKALDDTRDITGMGAMGTPSYMAPELFMGEAATPRSDQYSLACMAFEMLTGRLPYDVEDGLIRTAHIEQTPLSLSDVRPEISLTLSCSIARGLAKDPRQRHPGVRQLVAAARTADAAFRRSETIGAVVTTKGAQEAVRALSTEHGLSDAAISHFVNLDRTEVVRLRRRAARRALLGRSSPAE